MPHLLGAAENPRNPDSWCDSTDATKLDLVINAVGNRFFMTNVAKYQPTTKNCYYFVNWDLQGTHRDPKPIQNLQVEPNSLYLVHLYEIDKPRILTDFWAENAGKLASAAIVWVGGNPSPSHSPKNAPITGSLTEISESPAWFHYRKGDRLPHFSQRFPEFQLPHGKALFLSLCQTQDTLDAYTRRGVTHITGASQLDKIPRSRRAITIGSYFNQVIGEIPSNDPHISPTENAFIRSPLSHAVSKATIAANYDYIFLDEEFWHNDYHPATLQRLCLFAQEAKRINPTLKLADFWNPPPYIFKFIRHDRWTIDSVCNEAASHYHNLDAALKSTNPPLMRKVTVNGKPTCLADELTAVSQCVYFDNLFGFIEQYNTFSNDFFLPAAIHTSRINKRLPCNQGKPIIWFGMDILEGNYNHPRIPYPTRTTTPPGLVIFKDRLQVSPNFNEAISLFGLLEADGAYLWDAHGLSDGNPDGIFSTMQYCIDYHDDRGQWLPDLPGTPIGKNKTWYPYNMTFAHDYYALGAWKFSQIADILTAGKKTDFEYSMDAGKTWYLPPANGSTMPDVIRDRRPIVTGAVTPDAIAVVVFHPFQGVADTASLLIRHQKHLFAVDVFGTRPRVYRGTLAPTPSPHRDPQATTAPLPHTQNPLAGNPSSQLCSS